MAVVDERHVVSASGDRTLRVWDIETSQALAVFNFDTAASAVAVTADGRTVVAGDYRGGVHFLDLDLGKCNAPPIVGTTTGDGRSGGAPRSVDCERG